MKKILILSVLFLTLLTANSFALYVDVPESQPGLTEAYYSFDNDSYTVDVGSYAGAFILNFKEDEGSPISYSTYGFCVDLPVPDGPGSAQIDAITTDAFKKAAWILNANYNSRNTVIQNAGIQLAIWDVIYDYTNQNGVDVFIPKIDGSAVYSAYKLYHDDFKAHSPTTIINEFNTFADKYKIVNFENAGIQDMITTNPVPEPATMALFGLGLLGISLVGRKRR